MLQRANVVIQARGFPVEQYQHPDDYGKTFWNAFCTGQRYPSGATPPPAGQTAPTPVESSYWDRKVNKNDYWEQDEKLREELDKHVHAPFGTPPEDPKVSNTFEKLDCGGAAAGRIAQGGCGVPDVKRCKPAGQDMPP